MKRSIFLQTFGDTPLLRLFDFLIIHDDFDYSMTDIASKSGVSYTTVKTLWKGLERQKIIVMTRKVGKAKMYRLNDKNPVVVKLKEFYWTTAKNAVRKMTVLNR